MFRGDAKPSQSLTVLDNKLKVYQRVRYEESEAEIEDEVDVLMSSDIVAAQMSTKSITFTRSQSGWWPLRADKSDHVGTFYADFYGINGLCLESRKRREHLSDEDLQKNKAILDSLTKASGVSNGANVAAALALSDSSNSPPPRRKSLQPPIRREQSWEDYINSSPGKIPSLGRDMVCKENTHGFKATLAMVS